MVHKITSRRKEHMKLELLEQQIKLLRKQAIIVFDIVTKQRTWLNQKAPRPIIISARPADGKSSVAKLSNSPPDQRYLGR